MRCLMLLLILVSPLTQAGIWGDGKWGRMYWGSNPESTPNVAPQVNAQADGTDIMFVLLNLLTPDENGYSVVYAFQVTCNGLPTVTISADNPRLTGLDPETQYNCSIVAINDQGASPPGTFSVTTDAEGSPGLPIWLLYQATLPG